MQNHLVVLGGEDESESDSIEQHAVTRSSSQSITAESVAESCQLNPEALGLTPGGTTFFLPLWQFRSFRTVTVRNVFD